MRVVVVGGGYGGLASAARLAKLGHEVTLVERSDQLGGALGAVERGRLHLGRRPDATLLPGRGPRPVPQVRPAAGDASSASSSRST